MLLDNDSCHGIKLSNTKLKFFTANITVVMQTMDKGVVKIMKTHY